MKKLRNGTEILFLSCVLKISLLSKKNLIDLNIALSSKKKLEQTISNFYILSPL